MYVCGGVVANSLVVVARHLRYSVQYSCTSIFRSVCAVVLFIVVGLECSRAATHRSLLLLLLLTVVAVVRIEKTQNSQQVTGEKTSTSHRLLCTRPGVYVYMSCIMYVLKLVATT